jgi:tetratricopeptide (TPR) repeat protein
MTDYSNEDVVRQLLLQSARHLQQNEPKEAEVLLEPLYAAAPDNLDAAINLGGAYILQRKWSKAVNVLRSATAAHPETAMLWVNLAAAELGQLETAGPQHQEKAMAAYAKALELDPGARNVHYQLGLIRKERGELDEAAAMFRQALQVNPADRDARLWLDRIEQIQAELDLTDAAAVAPEQDSTAGANNGAAGSDETSA